MMPGFDLIHWSSHLMTRSIGSSAILLDCIYRIQRQKDRQLWNLNPPAALQLIQMLSFQLASYRWWSHIILQVVRYHWTAWTQCINNPRNMQRSKYANTTLPLPALLHHWTKKHKDFDHQWVTDNAPTLKSSPLLWRDWIKCHHPPSPPHHPPPQPLIQISPTWQFASWHRWKKWINTERIINSASPNPHHNQCKHHHHGTLN